jgi:phosphoribosylformylglycinamidine synthase PurS subunit
VIDTSRRTGASSGVRWLARDPTDGRDPAGGRVTPRVEVFVQLKPGMLDPQGATLEHALADLGYVGVTEVRVGKWITFLLEGADPSAVESTVDEMCRRLLANPVIERYRFRVLDEDEEEGS